ncbi:16374_t:CDS:10 [Acaulospora morrowiae]|uniref:16374_t:CDS:1 n=1 Tax=Acaulospora morrowiae TaxID=94023 RepID=A0A9N8YZ11_9GLOM|nr:16374_t:CDS:10 [Acaulospora morrowiae]
MSNRGGRGSNCYKCGEPGHLARDCSQSNAVCYNCGNEGHFRINLAVKLSRDCKETQKEKKCYSCGASGHLSRDCYSGTSSECYKCGNRGHTSRNCDADDMYGDNHKSDYRSTRGSNPECYKCGKSGHIARNCENYSEEECYRAGHIARYCRSEDYNAGKACYICGVIVRDLRNASIVVNTGTEAEIAIRHKAPKFVIIANRKVISVKNVQKLAHDVENL